MTAAEAKIAVETVQERVSRYRRVICALLFFATTVNYVDRQVLGILSRGSEGRHRLDGSRLRQHRRLVQRRLRLWSLLAGRLMDRIGTRPVMPWRSGVMGPAAMGHALARTQGSS